MQLTSQIFILRNVLMLLMLFGIYLSEGYGEAVIDTYKVKNVLSSKTLELPNGQTIELLGISVPDGHEASVKDLVKELTSNCRVIVLDAGRDKSKKIVYLWGNTSIRAKELTSKEVKPLSNVKVGFLNVQKGVAVNLNAYLIRRGYCLVDESTDFEFKNDFLELQAAAKAEKVGFWKNQ